MLADGRRRSQLCSMSDSILPPAVHLRDATIADVPLILQFIRGLADYERLAHEVVATEASLRATLFGRQPAAHVLLAELKGSPAGFALYFFNYSTFLGQPGLYLEDLFVEPSQRGRGVGRALLAQLATIAEARGCGRMEWSVLDWNADAIAFYRKLGAEGMDEWTVQRVTGDALTRLAAEGRGDRLPRTGSKGHRLRTTTQETPHEQLDLST